MNLVFVTRKIDRNDSRTGFVFDWLTKLAAKLDKLYVICQEKGDASGLPENIEIPSLGKEQGLGKLAQGFNLLSLSFSLGKKSDGFFVHMMPVYAIISGLSAKLLGKKMIFWYTHKSVNLKGRLATMLADEIFTASPESFRLASKKVRVVGHGIDIQKFQAPSSKLQINSKFQIISIGRISPVKDYETLIKAVAILVNEKNITDVSVNIYGEPAKPADHAYFADLKEFVRKAHLQNNIFFRGAVAHDKTPEIYQKADLLVNLSETGSLDKNVLEAAAAGTLVLSSNEAFTEKLSTISSHLTFEHDHPEGLAQKIETLKNLPTADRVALSQILNTWVSQEHNLANLVNMIVETYRP